MQMKVMTYNIHGWLTPDGDVNVDAVARVITESGADIVGLNEVFHPRPIERSHNSFSKNGASEQMALQLLAQRLGFHFVFGPCLRWAATDTLPASSYGNALLSRWPIIASAAHHLTPIDGIENRGLLEGRMLLPDGRTFTAYVTHLDYSSEANRLVQLRAVHSWTVRDRSRPHVVMGDFNAISPWEYEERERALAAVAAQPKAAHMALGVAGADEGKGKGPQVVGRMQKAGYTDAFSLFAERGQRTFLLSPEPLRIDYIFASAPLVPHLTDCQILFPAVTASDHVPVLAQIDF